MNTYLTLGSLASAPKGKPAKKKVAKGKPLTLGSAGGAK